jgi:hypothetical protein
MMTFLLLLIWIGLTHATRLTEAPTTMCFGNESSATSALPDGRWLCAVPQRRDALDTHCIYAPFNCRYGYWDRDSLVPMFDAFLQANGRPMWIFIGGDSRSRGIWLSLIDLLIDHRNLTSSRAWKCWGVSEFRTPSLRLTWHDMREQHKDPYREHGDHPELPRVKADFDAALSHDGRRPDVLVIQFGFDVLPADLAAAEGPPSTKRIMLSGWDYWKESQHLTHVSTPIDGWMYFDTQRLTLPMLDHMCDESDYRKHFHTNCGEYLCGFVNRMQSQMLFTTMFGPPPAPTHSDTQHLTHAPRLPPVRTFEMCTRCKTEFNTKYALDLPPFECQSNHLDSVMEINDRQFCVTRRLVLDGHAVKVKNRLAEHLCLRRTRSSFCQARTM